MGKRNIKILTYIIFVFVFGVFLIGFTTAIDATVCCQKTTSNLYCQNVPATQCASGSMQAPTFCSSTSFCKPGVCYNPSQGTCSDNTPQFVCEQEGGKWSDKPMPQCNLGCCILGDQAAFVTLVRCKYLAGKLGLQTNYNSQIKDEVQCVLSSQNQDKGACVYESEFEKTCKFTTRDECSGGINGTRSKGEFFKDKLCTAPELGAKCAPTSKTACIPGKEEVYFVDNCGNPANIYDASKIFDATRNDSSVIEYWSNVKKKEESCSAGASNGNANSKTCGNCNYLSGSICRAVTTGSSNAPKYGNNICVGLNCNDIGKRHGESWCVYDDKGDKSAGKNAVGSRFYKHICINGEELVEQCADFRGEECIEDKIAVITGNDFSQAACRVNRYQDCLFQGEKIDCENSERRDCIWKEGLIAFSNSTAGSCIPKNPPGLKFWEGDEAKTQCGKGSVTGIVTYEKGLLGGSKCVGNCDLIKPEWLEQRKEVCTSLGDCGPNVNWLGVEGSKTGFKYEKTKA